ncbi:MAG: hypothetical protein QME72_18000 [Rhodococcus sp. (in: high G+C Gram-positive bacteria)]|nr:hypothetical protein [Rhodococcus sp. (in: high G+C Gram-positive bacteria)]
MTISAAVTAMSTRAIASVKVGSQQATITVSLPLLLDPIADEIR